MNEETKKKVFSKFGIIALGFLVLAFLLALASEVDGVVKELVTIIINGKETYTEKGIIDAMHLNIAIVICFYTSVLFTIISFIKDNGKIFGIISLLIIISIIFMLGIDGFMYINTCIFSYCE